MENVDLTIFLCWLMIPSATSLSSANGVDTTKEIPEEYCQFDSFNPQCSNDEVIIMQSAVYGRMRTGRCVEAEEVEKLGRDPQILGCFVDVLSLLDAKCSGKTSCEMRVSDFSKGDRQPCFPGLKMYLEANYKCIKIADERRSCMLTVSGVPVHVDISKSVCGTTSQPWTVEAPKGQKLLVSLLDLTPSESQTAHNSQCQQRGYIVDRAARRNISMCAVGSRREKQLHTSAGNTIEIILNHQTVRAEDEAEFPKFLKFEAVGCSDIVPSEDNWLKRRDDVLVIGCYSSRQTWQFNCIAGKWVGVIGNCSKEMSKSEQVQASEEELKISGKAEVLAIVSICGFTLAICFIIVCIGALCLRRYYIQNKAKSDYRTLNYESDFGRSKEMTGQKTSSAFPTHRTGDAVNGSLAHQLPAYSVFFGQDGAESRDKMVQNNDILFTNG